MRHARLNVQSKRAQMRGDRGRSAIFAIGQFRVLVKVTPPCNDLLFKCGCRGVDLRSHAQRVVHNQGLVNLSVMRSDSPIARYLSRSWSP